MADQTLQYNEYVIGSNHPTETDTANRHALVEHNTDGTHKLITIDNDTADKSIYIDHDDTGAAASVDIDRDGNNAADIAALLINCANAGAGEAVGLAVQTGRVGVGLVAPLRDFVIASATPNFTLNATGLSLSANQQTAFSLNDTEFLRLLPFNATNGGVLRIGASTAASASACPHYLGGYTENEPTTYACFYYKGAKHDGAAALTAIAAGSNLMMVTNNGTARLTLLGDGSLGVGGIAAPSYPLHIKSNASHLALCIEENSGGEQWQIGVDADGDLNFHNSAGATPVATLADSSRFGIGTTAPDCKLHIMDGDASASSVGGCTATFESSGDCYVQLLSPNTNSCSVLFGDPESSSAASIGHNHSTGKMTLAVGSSVICITDGADVGIGTISPNGKLECQVDDNENVVGLLVDQDDGTNDPYAIEIQNAGTGDSIHDDSGAKLTAAGVWTDAPCFEAEKENIEPFPVDVIDKLKTLQLFQFQVKREVYGSKVGGKYPKKKKHADAPTRIGYILDHPSTPDELKYKNTAGEVTGISSTQNTIFILAAMKEIVDRVEKLEKKGGPN